MLHLSSLLHIPVGAYSTLQAGIMAIRCTPSSLLPLPRLAMLVVDALASIIVTSSSPLLVLQCGPGPSQALHLLIPSASSGPSHQGLEHLPTPSLTPLPKHLDEQKDKSEKETEKERPSQKKRGHPAGPCSILNPAIPFARV